MALLHPRSLRGIEVESAAKVRVLQRRSGHRRLQRLAVERTFQNRLHAPIGTGSGGDGSRRSRFQTLGRVALAQPKNPQTRPVAHLRVRFTFQNGGEQLSRGRSHRLRPTEQTRGRPSQVLLVALRPMLGNRGGLIGLTATRMRCHPLAEGGRSPRSSSSPGSPPTVRSACRARCSSGARTPGDSRC